MGNRYCHLGLSMKLILLFFLLITNINCYAQIDSLVELVKVYDRNEIENNEYMVFINGKETFVVDQSQDIFTIINLSTNDKLSFSLPDTIPYYNPESFCINNNVLCYFDWKAAHCFNFPDGDHLMSIDYDACPRGIKGIYNKIYLYGITYCGYIDKYDQSAVTTIDFTTKTIETKYFPNPSASGFSFFQPSNVMDLDKDQVYLADYDNYRILIYDHNGNLSDSIKRETSEWIRNNQKIPEYPLGSIEPVKYIQEIRPISTSMSYIHNIFLVRENQLLVNWSIPTGELYKKIMRYDLWEFDDYKWKLIKSDIKDFQENLRDDINDYSIPIKYYFRVDGTYLIIQHYGTSKELFEKYQGKTYGEFQEACDEYFLDHDLKSIIGVYKFK